MKISTMKLLVLGILISAFAPIGKVSAQEPKTPADLHKLARDYYNWRNQNYPVTSIDAGLHTWEDKLTNYSLSPILARRLQAIEILGKVLPTQTATWNTNDTIEILL